MGMLARSLLAAVIGAGVLGVTVAHADDVRESLETRQSLMKLKAALNRTLKAAVEGGDLERAGSTAAELSEVSAKIPEAFETEAHVGNADGVKTTSSPAIYDRWDEFVKIAKDMEAAAAEVAAAAEAGDAAKVTEAYAAVGKTCGACHTPFRVKDS